ncbi:MAG TPA: glycosyltransferase family 1 protein [Methylocella sp.]|nr:glycosyltransferase family 1 protein [Methylocella sp.]
MLSTLHGLANTWGVSSFLHLDTLRVAAVPDLAKRADLRHAAAALCSRVRQLSFRLREAFRDIVVAKTGAPCRSLYKDVHADAGEIQRLRWLVRTPPAREPFKPGEQKALFGAIYLDLTDIVCHALWHDTCAGIPRVQLEITNSLMKSGSDVRPIAFHHEQWWELQPLIEAADGDVDAIFCLIKDVFADFKWTRRGLAFFLKRRRKLRAMKHSSRMPELDPQDTLFIGGAFWIKREIIDFCVRSANHGAKLTILLHDLMPLINPYFTGHDFSTEFLEILRLPAHFIVTTSRNGQDLEVVRRGHLAKGPLTSFSVVALADEFPGSVRNAPPLAASDRLTNLIGVDFVLCVGTIEVRKNHLTLLSVWEQLAAELGDRLPCLVIAGRRGWKAETALEKLDRANSTSKLIRFVEAPTDGELRWLYASCQFTVFPSYFEGWGLPVGESFWFGKPCAASNMSSIPAVGRDLCSYFSPFDPEEMTRAIRALLNPTTRRLYQARIQSTPLRTWKDVASDIKTIITDLCALPSDAIQSPAER